MNCTGGIRHWFTIRGTVGLRSPVCVRCDEPNPRPLSDDEWNRLRQYRDARGSLGMHAAAALRRHAAEERAQ